jgi:hypothetical protein
MRETTNQLAKKYATHSDSGDGETNQGISCELRNKNGGRVGTGDAPDCDEVQQQNGGHCKR